MYAITKITVMCNGERTERVEGIYLTGHKAKRAMKKLYRFLLAEGHRPEPFFDEDNSIITLPSSAEELLRLALWANYKQREAELVLRAKIDKILRCTEEVNNG